MHSVSKTFSFCYGHRLMNDEGRCKHLHGHTARATIVLECPSLNKCGMVVHFDRLNETIGRWIAENLDHTLLLCENDALAKVLKSFNEKFLSLEFNPTAENLAQMIFEETRSFGLPVIRVDVWESETSKASYAT